MKNIKRGIHCRRPPQVGATKQVIVDDDRSLLLGLIYRLRCINRWALNTTVRKRNVMEHSYLTTVIAHALVHIHNSLCTTGRVGVQDYSKCGITDEDMAVIHKAGTYRLEDCLMAAMYHDVIEGMTGDIPSPIKRYSNEIYEALAKLDEHCSNKLVHEADKLNHVLARDIKEALVRTSNTDGRCMTSTVNTYDAGVKNIITAADLLAAYAECLEELGMGNKEFTECANNMIRLLGDISKAVPALKVILALGYDSIVQGREELGCGDALLAERSNEVQKHE